MVQDFSGFTIKLTRGRRRVYELSVLEDGAAPYNWPGSAVYFAARKSPPAGTVASDSGADIAMSTSDHVTITDSGGGVRLDFVASLTESMEVSNVEERLYAELCYVPSGESDPRQITTGLVYVHTSIVRAV